MGTLQLSAVTPDANCAQHRFFPPSSRTPSDGYLLTTKEKQEVGAPRLKVRRKLLEKVFAES
jgi:hypothetical protein